MKLWVDDLREPPDGTWLIARTSDTALGILHQYIVSEVSLDHDLGGEDTIEPVLTYLQEAAFHGFPVPTIIRGHSSNPVGMAKIQAVAQFCADKRV